MRKKKIVCFGGGGAMPQLILEPLKNFNFDIVSITSMVDNGGSTGALRKEFNTMPAGDIRRHLLALSEGEKWKKELWQFRFAKDIEISPQHFGHNFANVFITGLESIFGNFEEALNICHQFLNVKGMALPAILDKVQLVAELEDGSLIEGEEEIDLGKNHNRDLKIKNVYLKPKARAYQKAIDETRTADNIIIGPGDLYSSLIPCFLGKGWKETMAQSQAKKIFICPAMTKWGETQNYSIKDFTEAIEKYLGVFLDFVIFNNNIPSKDTIKKYQEEKKEEFVLNPPIINNDLDKNKFIGEDLLLDGLEIKYDQQKLFSFLKKIINF